MKVNFLFDISESSKSGTVLINYTTIHLTLLLCGEKLCVFSLCVLKNVVNVKTHKIFLKSSMLRNFKGIYKMLGYQNFPQKMDGVWKFWNCIKMGHENLCAFSEISSAPVCAIINDHSLIGDISIRSSPKHSC